MEREDYEQVKPLLLHVRDQIESVFPSENYDLKSHCSENGYGFTHKKVQYEMDFQRIKGRTTFTLEAKLLKDDPELQSRLEEHTYSNKYLKNESTYFSRQDIDANEKSIKIKCRLKKYPKETKNKVDMCKEAWAYILNPVLLAIGKYAKSQKNQ
jgi:hypothetical protein